MTLPRPWPWCYNKGRSHFALVPNTYWADSLFIAASDLSSMSDAPLASQAVGVTMVKQSTNHSDHLLRAHHVLNHHQARRQVQLWALRKDKDPWQKQVNLPKVSRTINTEMSSKFGSVLWNPLGDPQWVASLPGTPVPIAGCSTLNANTV